MKTSFKEFRKKPNSILWISIKLQTHNSVKWKYRASKESPITSKGGKNLIFCFVHDFDRKVLATLEGKKF